MLVNGLPANTISIHDRGLLYGDGVFRTLRAVRGKVLCWSLHYLKLQHDCAKLNISCPEESVLLSELAQLLGQYPDAALKLIVTRGEGERGYVPPTTSEPTRIWDVSPLPQYPSENSRCGVRIGVCGLRLSAQPRLAGIKHLNRLENVLAASERADADIAESLLLDDEGNVIEGIRSNLFMVTAGTLVTPDLSRCGVAGIQRERVMVWALKQNVPLQVRNVGLDELMQADELFMVNSLIGLWPVRELQQRRWDIFPLAGKISQYLENGES
ncbi:MAG: aminodeoxychorismate lyase [Gallionella sp.]|nr:aminodeoxychorismate lyase [Gallionella sp.]